MNTFTQDIKNRVDDFVIRLKFACVAFANWCGWLYFVDDEVIRKYVFVTRTKFSQSHTSKNKGLIPILITRFFFQYKSRSSRIHSKIESITIKDLNEIKFSSRVIRIVIERTK